jgi:transcriptional regulator with XRE-family HTH domain
MTADEFRAALKACGLRQNALAELLGVHIMTVNKWAKGLLPVAPYAVAYLDLFYDWQVIREREGYPRESRNIVRGKPTKTTSNAPLGYPPTV